MRKYIDIINELTRPRSRDNAEMLLRRAGYKHMGSGSFAGVYAREDKPYVVKLFTASDEGYLAYLDLISTHENIHFPKLLSKPIKITDTYYGIKLEKLTPINTYIDFAFSDKIVEYTQALCYGNTKADINKEFKNEYPTLSKALDLIFNLTKTNPDIGFDIKSNNMMYRGNTLVITDPVA